MCGRINYRIDRWTRLKLAELGLDPDSIPDPPLPATVNIAPTEPVPVVHRWDERIAFNYMRWWLHPQWSREEPNQKYAMFNARIETIASSRAYKGPFRHRRCVLPVSAFIEWQRLDDGSKQPYLLEAEDDLLLLAGVWDLWQEQLLSCAVVTEPADSAFEHIHQRMPLTLSTEQAQRWLNHEENPEALLKALIGSRVPLTATPVSPAINNAKHKVEAKPVGDPRRID